MSFQSKAHMKKMEALVKSGHVSQEEFDKRKSETLFHDHLPDRVTKAPKPKTLLRKARLR